MMTDKEKLDWFNETMDWIEKNGGPDEMIDAADDSHDMPYDLFYDVLDQYKKERGLV